MPSIEDPSMLVQTTHTQPTTNTSGVVSHPKQKKRTADVNEAALEDISSKAKKKRRKNSDSERHEVGEQTQKDEPAPSTSVKTKKKKDKDRAKESQNSTQHSGPSEDPNLQASALLSAIVAAAAGTPDTMTSQPELLSHHHPFLPFPPPMDYGFDISFPAQHLSPPIPFSELSFGSNEDVLRALQDLDMSKIASVLKNLGEVASATNPSNFSLQAAFMPPSSSNQVTATPLGQVPVTANTILGLPSKNTTAPTHKRTLDLSEEQHTNPDHAHLLATKWLNANKLAELVKTEGLIYKKGKFSAIEEQLLNDAIENYCTAKQLTDQQLLDVIFPQSEKVRDNAFWSELTAAVPQRPIIAVYHHVRRNRHPLNRAGDWTKEQDALLKQAVTELGQQWEKISKRVGRMSSDCRDRYRNHIHNREIRVTGHWSKEEEDLLTKIVTDMTIRQGRDIDNDVFWGRVSELMGGTRGRQQCRIKWTDSLSKTVKNEGQKPRWSQQDAFILVHKIDSLNVRDDTEIDWKTISDADWNLWSAHTLQRRWLTMKRSVKGFEDMTHQEIMDILRVKKAHLPNAPPAAVRKRKGRKVTSAEAINDAGDVLGQAEAGPSIVHET